MKLQHIVSVAFVASTLFVCADQAVAAELLPSFSSVPAGWVVDRYAPDSFSNVGAFQGQNNVLGIGIGPNGAYANRPGGFQSQFYDTQGMQYALFGGAGDSLSAWLYLPSSWLDSANGAARTDMWGVMTDATSAVSDYPIIGFTNEGDSGYVGFRVWDENIGWINLNTQGIADGWNSLSIAFSGSDFLFYLNGNLVYDELNSSSSTNFSALIMQAYNFDDSVNWSGVNATPYTAHWVAAVDAVPEPAVWAMMLIGFFSVGTMMRRARRTQTFATA